MTAIEASHSLLAKAANWQVFGKSPVRLYLRLNKWVWHRLSLRTRDSNLIRSYGTWLHTLVCLCSRRQQYFGTFFLRNRPALELMQRLCNQKTSNATVKIAVLGCSIGAEVYSILWVLRSVRPDLRIVLNAVDISREILTFAKGGVYDSHSCAVAGSSIFERLTDYEKQEMFDWKGNEATVKQWFRTGINWELGDAASPELPNLLGIHDIVVASNFLCHMAPDDAEKCLCNMVRLVKPGGYLFVSGVDLDVRTKVALDLGWKPMLDLIAEVHDGDESVRADWPWCWWGLEPFDRRRADWQTRYAAFFQVAESEPARTSGGERDCRERIHNLAV
jgi:SAM-dependent methyltransferase